jgi:hypothetical protein
LIRRLISNLTVQLGNKHSLITDYGCLRTFGQCLWLQTINAGYYIWITFKVITKTYNFADWKYETIIFPNDAQCFFNKRPIISARCFSASFLLRPSEFFQRLWIKTRDMR